MRLISALFLILLFMFPLACAFSAYDYLYPGEKEADISTERIGIGGKQYELVMINNKNVFLVDGGELVSDDVIIMERVRQYYTEKFYPTSSEFSGLRAYITSFNDSVDGMTEYGNARHVCAHATSIEISPCNDTESCMLPAMTTCIRTGSACDVPLFASYIADYVQNLAKLDEHNANALKNLDSADVYNIQSKLSSVKLELDSSEIYANKILESKLMYPENVSECPDCLGICPLPPFDFGSLDSAREGAMLLKQKSLPMDGFDAVGDQIVAETAARLVYKSKECADGTKHGTCSSEKPKYCLDRQLMDKASACGCPEGLEKIGESCVKKVGCAYNNPACADSFECINNTCVLRKGCRYGNPQCDEPHECINNSCILKPGCDYGNPACSEGEECVNNTCYKTCGVTRERVEGSRAKLEAIRRNLQVYPEKSLLLSQVHKANGDEDRSRIWISVHDDFLELNATLAKTIRLLESYDDKPAGKCAFRESFEQDMSQLDSRLGAIHGKIAKG